MHSLSKLGVIVCFSKVLSLDTPLHLCHPCTYKLVGTSSIAIKIPSSQHFYLQDEHFPDLGISRTQERVMTGRIKRIKSSRLGTRDVREGVKNKEKQETREGAGRRMR